MSPRFVGGLFALMFGLVVAAPASAGSVCGVNPTVRTYSECRTPGHSYLIVNGQVIFQGASASVSRSGSFQAAGNGIIPNTKILFEFRTAFGAVAHSHLTQNARSNCVVNQEPETINASVLLPGTYQVYTSFWSANKGETGAPFNWPICRNDYFVGFLTVT
jgi:hypothetical protein